MDAQQSRFNSEEVDQDASAYGSLSAGVFFSSDFDWETLRAEIEDSPRHKSETLVNGSGSSASADIDSICATLEKLKLSAWEAFHKSHNSKSVFFKERRYLVKEFPELLSAAFPTRLLEVGCGTGSSVVPILRANKNVIVHACDCSPSALARATEVVTKQQADLPEQYIQPFRPFLCDVSVDALPSWLCCASCRGPVAQQGDVKLEKKLSRMIRSQPSGIPLGEPCCLGGVNIVTLIFTLSAIPPEKMLHVLSEIAAVLQPGGWLLFRDYGLYDMTMRRFPPSQKISERLYRRQDGTLSYFFSLEAVKKLFSKVGLVEDELQYCCVQLTNRRTARLMKRVWIHAKFRKPQI